MLLLREEVRSGVLTFRGASPVGVLRWLLSLGAPGISLRVNLFWELSGAEYCAALVISWTLLGE